MEKKVINLLAKAMDNLSRTNNEMFKESSGVGSQKPPKSLLPESIKIKSGKKKMNPLAPNPKLG